MSKRSCRSPNKRTSPAHEATLPPALEHELLMLENIVRLTAFAVEARRILDGIEMAKDNFPECKERISQVVDYSGQWSCHEDTSASVLVHVADRLADIVVKV